MNAIEQFACRLVAWVLRDQLTLEGALENGLPKTGGAGELHIELRSSVINNGETLLDLSYRPTLPLWRR